MAKGIGLVGSLSGRSGNFVFSKGINGKTIVRPYQPIVANPNTASQRDVRARFLAATSLANGVSDLALMGLKSSARSAGMGVKNALAQQVLKGGNANFERTENAGTVTMSIKNETMRGLQFSKGNVPANFSDSVMSVDPNDETRLMGTFKVALPATDAGKYKVVMIAQAIKTGRFQAKIYNLSAVVNPEDEYALQFSPSFNFNALTEEATSVTFWAYIVKAGENASTSYYAIVNGADAVTSESLSGASYSPTVFLGNAALPA